MKSAIFKAVNSKIGRTFLWVAVFSGSIALIMPMGLYSNQTPAPNAPAREKTFDTPAEAVDALVLAAERNDVTALLEIFGAGGADIISTGDKVADKNVREAFVTKAREKKRIATDRSQPNRAVLYIGADNWPLPIPLVKEGSKWRFDTKAGRNEILARRIGENELNAISLSQGYVEAQKEYSSEIHDGKKPNQYAQRIISTQGKHDGLYWKNDDGSSGGPIGDAVAKAIEQGYTTQGIPFHGYYFKILKGQGPAAPMGELDFVVRGAMIGGFALAAAPAQYRVTGVQTFIINQDGVIYQKDLGPDTLNVFKSMDRYNPDKTWKKTPEKFTRAVTDMQPKGQ